MAITQNNRELVFDEEIKRNAGVSEALGKKLGGIANFLMTDQVMRDDFKANGAYRLGVGSVGIDGILVFPTKVEIVYIAGSNVKNGTTGKTDFDIHWLDAPNSDQGSIFSTKPSIDVTAGDNAYFLRDVINNIDVVTGTGIVTPTVNKTEFLAGEAIRVDLDDAQAGGRDCQLNVYYRPIT